MIAELSIGCNKTASVTIVPVPTSSMPLTALRGVTSNNIDADLTMYKLA